MLFCCNSDERYYLFIDCKQLKQEDIIMKNQQTIMCDVEACKYHNDKKCCCNLEQITVSPCNDCETAHYCKDYEKKSSY